MMENNKTISAKELDGLLKQAFLNLDFNQPVNAQVLEAVGSQFVRKTGFFTSVANVVFTKLMLWSSLLIIVAGLVLYLKTSTPSNTAIVPLAVKTSLVMPSENSNGEIIQAKPVTKMDEKKYTASTEKNEIQFVSPQIIENVILSGYIKNIKSNEALSGVAVYKLKSAASVLSNEHGYFSLVLSKGENDIGVSLLGYQTFTFSVYLDGNTVKDVELTQHSRALDEVVVQTDNYLFPTLTEKEKKANEREKQKMARLAAKLKSGNDYYPFIPAPTDKSFEGFYMASGEITNLDYRTFLFDLLINGKKNEFLIAKPVQELWVNAGGVHIFDTLARIYFSEKKYNPYPVVNVSVAGAEMYCKWLEGLVNMIRQKENRSAVKIGLPLENEWRYAASAGNAKAVYPWFTDSVQNKVHWFLANCCIQKQTEKLKHPFNKTVKHPLGDSERFELQAYTSAGLTTKNKLVATIDTWSYNPNDFLLYNMCGNVSEMVYRNDKKGMKAKGGNWNSDADHLKFNNDDEFDDKVTPSPMIGFRVRISVVK